MSNNTVEFQAQLKHKLYYTLAISILFTVMDAMIAGVTIYNVILNVVLAFVFGVLLFNWIFPKEKYTDEPSLLSQIHFLLKWQAALAVLVVLLMWSMS